MGINGALWAVYAAIWAFSAMTPWVAARAGQVRLVVKRRGTTPQSYTPLVGPKNEDARYTAKSIWERIAQRQKPARSRGLRVAKRQN